MNSRDARMAAVCAAGLLGTCMLNPVSAETIAVPNGIAVRDSSVPTPTRGMTMDEVAGKFGAPAAKIPAVGQPAHIPMGISGFRGLFRIPARHSQRGREFLTFIG